MKSKSSKGNRRFTRSRKSDGGKMLRVHPHPPDFCSAPWYNLTVRVDSVPAVFGTVQLQAAIASQLQITFSESRIDVRLQDVRVWGALPNDNSRLNSINVFIMDPIGITTPTATGNAGTGARILEQLTGYPDRVSRACLGYRYPKAQREVSIRCSNQGVNQLMLSNGLGNGSVAYFRVQWRPVDALPPNVESLLEQFDLGSDTDSEIEILSTKSKKRSK